MSGIRLHGRTLRLTVWCGLGVIVLAQMTIAHSSIPLAAQNLAMHVIGYLVPLVLALLGSALVGANSRRLGADSRFWGLMAAALASMFAGEVQWAWYATHIDPHGAPLDSPWRLSFLLAAMLFTAMSVSLAKRGDEPLAIRLRAYIDILCAVTIAHPLVYRFWTLPAFSGLPHAQNLAAQAALYPIFGVVMPVSILIGTSGWIAGRWRPWERLILAANGVFGLGLVMFPLWYRTWLGSESVTRDWFGVLLGVGLYLMFVAVVYRLTAADDDGLADVWSAPRLNLELAGLLPVVYSAAFPVLFWAAFRSRQSEGVSPVMVAAVSLGLLLAARSWLSALELAQLRRRRAIDPITGVYNAGCLRARLDETVETAVAAGYPFALVLFEIEGFRLLERMFGREIARHVLREVAGLCQRLAPTGASVFRLGSSEFVVVLQGRDVSDANLYAQTVCKHAVAEASPDMVSPLTLLAGVAAFPRHALAGDELVACARIALAHVSERGETTTAIYNPETHGAGGAEDEDARRRLRALQGTVRALAAAVDARDSDTRHHSANVGRLATALARYLELPQVTIELIDLAAQMHDVGKIAIPDDVLLKLGLLTPEERAVVQDHCALGECILAPANLDEILPLVRHHHERWDGAGYPDGLKGHDIPLEARILAVCDTFETITTGRRYCSARPVDVALKVIESEADRQFDPIVAAAFVTMVRAEGVPSASTVPHAAAVVTLAPATTES